MNTNFKSRVLQGLMLVFCFSISNALLAFGGGYHSGNHGGYNNAGQNSIFTGRVHHGGYYNSYQNNYHHNNGYHNGYNRGWNNRPGVILNVPTNTYYQCQNIRICNSLGQCWISCY